jgi:hypothetical protein
MFRRGVTSRPSIRPRARRWAAVAVTVVLAAGLAPFVQASPAWALCGSTTCNGDDPQDSGCSAGATTIDDFVSEQDGYAYVELRYSPACNAAWARWTVGAPGMPKHRYLKLQVWNASSGGTMIAAMTKLLPSSTGNGAVYWTAMYSFTYWVQACVKTSSGNGPCTARM